MEKIRVIQCSDDHNNCIISTVKSLMERGYRCYLEYEIYLHEGKRQRLSVDIYAVRNNEEVLIEVGTLSNVHGDRLKILKQLKPKAKVIHIMQWKNFGITGTELFIGHYNWLMQKRFRPMADDLIVDMQRMGESLSRKTE